MGEDYAAIQSGRGLPVIEFGFVTTQSIAFKCGMVSEPYIYNCTPKIGHGRFAYLKFILKNTHSIECTMILNLT
jgi:hypothetical protein